MSDLFVLPGIPKLCIKKLKQEAKMCCEMNLRGIPFLISSAIIGISVLLSLSMCGNVLVVAENTNQAVKPLTATAYVKFLQLRRKEQQSLVQDMLKSDYTKNYKMISMAMEKIFQVFKDSNQTLIENDYSPSLGFPTEINMQEAVVLLLENCCLVSDIILHFPEISYRILKKVPDWKHFVNWCIGFVNLFPQITDEPIAELMDLVRQEVNEEERSDNFINPYNTNKEYITNEVKKKHKRKSIKKGPYLTRTEL